MPQIGKLNSGNLCDGEGQKVYVALTFLEVRLDGPCVAQVRCCGRFSILQSKPSPCHRECLYLLVHTPWLGGEVPVRYHACSWKIRVLSE
jgi:hypothetical protein